MRVDLRPISSTWPLISLELDRIAAPERPVEDDRQRREQILEDALRGEADGDAADAEAGDQAGDVDAQIVEHDDQRDREDRDADQQPDDPHRAADAAGFLIAAGAMLDDAERQLARPERRLQRRRDDEGDLRDPRPRARAPGRW